MVRREDVIIFLYAPQVFYPDEKTEIVNSRTDKTCLVKTRCLGQVSFGHLITLLF